ncbi:MAG TPA: DUF3604 domain-containing protein, partial [Pyrinomonadaceae bacterium]|nr:DUF3604 domain-containing protein [Pyrinomonadaceae bacterium]
MGKRRLIAIMMAAVFAVALGTVLSRAERNRKLRDEAAVKKAEAATVASALPRTKSAQTVPSNPDRDCFFGQTHSHTSWSVDAYLIGNHLTTPEDAYKYSLGMPIKHPAGFDVQLKGRPLDFHGVTDHSEYAGVIPLANDPTSDLSKQPVAKRLQANTPDEFSKVFQWLAGSLAKHEPIKELLSPEIAGSVWRKNVDIADKYYQPGKFTTFASYEWTSMPNNRNMHRNVFFRDSKKIPVLPFTAIDSLNPEDLWTWLDGQRKLGNEAFAISHNANLSDGIMFPLDVDSKGRPIDAAWAQSRLINEPLTEIHQVKGTSETNPGLSPNDEFANYEIMSFKIGLDNSTSKLNGSYIREAYQNGLAMQVKRGYNPYKMGVVGASDSHNTAVPYSQSNNFGSHGMTDGSPKARLAGRVESGMAILQTSVSGLGGVWAESNTRESIFDAMRRKEVFGTSGVRIKVRLFGGWDFKEHVFNEKDWVKTGYKDGVPMGGEMPARKGKEPTFIVWAIKDPDDANLDRIQIVKGWTKDGQIFEKVYDVAWSGDRKLDPKTHKVPAVGDTVDIKTATYTNTIGAVELKKVWKDPEFDPGLHAFYYVRVLQIPTPRWSTYDAAKEGVAPPAGVSATVQERAWTTPIWYAPAGQQGMNRDGTTIDDLKTNGAVALDDSQLKELVIGKTLAV